MSPLLTVDLSKVGENYRLLQKQATSDCMTAGVVKADCYGLGLEAVLPVLEAAGCSFYYVATLDEALALRRISTKPVAVFNGLMPGSEAEYAAHDIIPVLNSPAQIVLWHDFSAARGKELPAILHFDTGMNRLGLTAKESADLIAAPESLEGLRIITVMSHFACADEKDHPLTAQQASLFADIARHFPQARKSLCNSSGIFTDTAYHHSELRPGQALYGLNPIPYAANPMQPVVSLQAPILQVKTATEQSTAGYGATYRFEKKQAIGIVPLGYADGFFRALSNKGKVYFNGRPCPIVGRVSMDLTIVDLGDARPQAGDMVEILGPHQSADDLAAAAGTIGYEVLTALGRRYRRVYKAAGEARAVIREARPATG